MTYEEFKEAFKKETIILDNDTSVNPATLVAVLLKKYEHDSPKKMSLLNDLKRVMSKQHVFLEKVVNIRLTEEPEERVESFKRTLDELHEYNQNELRFLREKWNYRD